MMTMVWRVKGSSRAAEAMPNPSPTSTDCSRTLFASLGRWAPMAWAMRAVLPVARAKKKVGRSW
jgi:hypothetical protein